MSHTTTTFTNLKNTEQAPANLHQVLQEVRTKFQGTTINGELVTEGGWITLPRDRTPGKILAQPQQPRIPDEHDDHSAYLKFNAQTAMYDKDIKTLNEILSTLLGTLAERDVQYLYSHYQTLRIDNVLLFLQNTYGKMTLASFQYALSTLTWDEGLTGQQNFAAIDKVFAQLDISESSKYEKTCTLIESHGQARIALLDYQKDNSTTMDYNHLKDFLCRRLTAPNFATAYQISENPMATLQQRIENLETQRFLAAYQVSEEHPHPPWGQKSDRNRMYCFRHGWNPSHKGDRCRNMKRGNAPDGQPWTPAMIASKNGAPTADTRNLEGAGR